MKVLEDTPAVLSLGKRGDEHGYSYEWINGQKPHLIKNCIRRQCKTENFGPIVVPGLSASSSSSSSTSTPMTSSKEIDHSDHPPTIVSSESVDRQVLGDPYSSETSEELLNKPTKIPKQKKKIHEQVQGDPYYSDILEWLQEIRENLVDGRVLEHRDSHASSSHESSLVPMRSVDLGKHTVYMHFPKDRNCKICQRTNITRAPCRRRIGRVVPRAENFGDLITADHKVLKVTNLETIIDVQSWCKTWPPNGSNHIRARKKLLRKHKGACGRSWSRIGILKSFTLTITWNLAKLVKIFPGIIVRRHHTDRKQMGLLREQYAE